MARRRLLGPLLVALAAAAACGAGGAEEAATTTTTLPEASTAAPTTTPPAGGWERIDAPSTCRCSDGSPYHFYLRRGDPHRVAYHLEGGGACFSAETCGPAAPTYTRSLAGHTRPPATGMFDLDDERNPFAGWSMVYVPYCTGDLHLGDADHDYGDDVVVHHGGAVNAGTALAAGAAAFPDATDVVVTGSSAGSASAPLYGGMAHDLVPDARITVVADASGAYPRDEVITDAIGTLWGTFEHLPPWPSSADEPTSAWSLPGLFVRAGRHAPDITMATIDNAYDDVQARFSALIGSTGDLRDQITENHRWVEEQGVELATWMTPGTGHTALGRDELYEIEVDGVRLRDWLADLVAGEAVPDVACTACR